MGVSDRLREVIVSSLRIAANFGKKQAGIEDFLLAILSESKEKWFPELLDFVGISPKFFEQQLIGLNNLQTRSQNSYSNAENEEIFGPIDEIMNMIENHLGNENSAKVPNENSPFAHNPPPERRDSKTPALDFFGTDLVREAHDKKLDPVIGRNTEVDRLISILNRKTKNNPCLVGEPGVGKTAVVEGLARRIAEGNVPFAMQSKRIVMLDLPSMLAGTKYR